MAAWPPAVSFCVRLLSPCICYRLLCVPCYCLQQQMSDETRKWERKSVTKQKNVFALYRAKCAEPL